MSPDDPVFWEEWYPDDVAKPQGWENFSSIERCIVAHDGAGVDEAIRYYLGAEGGIGWRLSDDKSAILSLVPEFRTAVKSLILRNRIEARLLTSLSSEWDEASASDAGII